MSLTAVMHKINADDQPAAARRCGRARVSLHLPCKRGRGNGRRIGCRDPGEAGLAAVVVQAPSWRRALWKAITEAIDAANAVVVLWSAASVRSAWVEAEATRAFEQGKLVPLRFSNLHPNDIPPPFNTLHTLLLDDQAGLIQALERLVDANRRPMGIPLD